LKEEEFADELVGRINRFPDVIIRTKKSLLYAVTVGEDGRLQLGVGDDGEPSKGGGKGFEQDILVFERADSPIYDTTVVPRVAIEVKFRRVNTHDPMVYSEKARRIRTIYPYVRYGLLLGQMARIPPRVLRLGQEFDFITVLSDLASDEEIGALSKLIEKEVKASRDLGPLLSGKKRITSLHRQLILGSSIDRAS
jgi:hypothetical protein